MDSWTGLSRVLTGFYWIQFLHVGNSFLKVAVWRWFAPLTEAVVERNGDADFVGVRQQDAASDQVAVVQNVPVSETRALPGSGRSLSRVRPSYIYQRRIEEKRLETIVRD